MPKVDYIDNNLESKQNIVDGNIEYVYRDYYPGVVFICNEEGKLNGSSLNRDIGGDIIAGTFIITGDDPKEGIEKSLTDSQIQKYQQVFDEKSIENTNIKIAEILFNKDIEI